MKNTDEGKRFLANIKQRVEDEITRIIREKTDPTTITYLLETIPWPEDKTLVLIYEMQDRGIIYLNTEENGAVSVSMKKGVHSLTSETKKGEE